MQNETNSLNMGLCCYSGFTKEEYGIQVARQGPLMGSNS